MRERQKKFVSKSTISELLKNLRAEEPRLTGLRVAAVSMILADDEEPTVLLIRRSERDGDPWSGQIAFPGGKMQPGDVTAMDTAVRETMEEVGIDLAKDAKFLGYADATPTHTGTMEVVPCVFLLSKRVDVSHNPEVASHRWVGLNKLLSPGSKGTYALQRGSESMLLPALKVDDYVVWGLTHRIVSTTFRAPGPSP